MINKQSFHFTQDGFGNLKKELQVLESRRPQVVINLTNAREQGDLAENAGFHAAKDELSQIDGRIREIKYLLRIGKVVGNSESYLVAFGKTVTVSDGQKETSFMVVEELEANPAVGKISTNSPIG